MKARKLTELELQICQLRDNRQLRDNGQLRDTH